MTKKGHDGCTTIWDGFETDDVYGKLETLTVS